MSVQDNWRWCHKCEGLWFAGITGSRQPDMGVCPGGDVFAPGHDWNGSGNYSLPSEAEFPDGQHGWRFCRKCRGMFFGANVHPDGSPDLGRCSAGDSHDPSASGEYAIGSNRPDIEGTDQTNWFFCSKCAGMFFGGNARPDGSDDLGHCPAGGTHDHSMSGNYNLVYGPTVYPVRTPHLLTWQSFASPLQDDCDVVEVTTAPNPEFPLQSWFAFRVGPEINFWKELRLVTPYIADQFLQADGGNRAPGSHLVILADDVGRSTLVFSKGKFLNVPTAVYQLSSVVGTEGKITTFTWNKDHC